METTPHYPGITPGQFIETLLLHASVGQAVLLLGPSGVGKSDCAIASGRDPDLKALAWGQWATSTGKAVPEAIPDLEVFQTNLNGKEAEDLTGLPWLQVLDTAEGRVTRHAPPSFLRHEHPVILFLDEVSGLDPRIQKVLLQIIHERRMDDALLPAGTVIVLAGNRSVDRAATRQILFPLGNRVATYSFESSAEDWIAWARAQGPNIHPVFQAWVREKGLPGLHGYNPSDPSLAQLTPRSLANAARAYTAGKASGRSQTVIENGIVANIGWGAATELLEFIRIVDVLPRWDEITTNPEEAVLPQEGRIDQIYYLACAFLTHLGKEKATVEAAGAAGRYLARLSKLVPSASDAVSWFMSQFLKEHSMTDPVAVATLKAIKDGNPKLSATLKKLAA